MYIVLLFINGGREGPSLIFDLQNRYSYKHFFRKTKLMDLEKLQVN